MTTFSYLRVTGIGLLVLACASPLWSQSRGGGRSGGGISRPSGGGARPGGGSARPSGGGSRPNVNPGGMNRPSSSIQRPTPSRPQTRPSTPGNPGANRPSNPISSAKPGISRPTSPVRPTTPSTRPGDAIARPNLPSTKPNLPTTRPGGGATTLPSTRPNLPNRPGGIGDGNLNLGQRPGINPGDRPGSGLNPNAPGLWNRPGNKLPPGIGDNRPGIGGDRPGIGNNLPGTGGNLPGLGNNRPGIGGDRPGIGDNRPGIGNNRPGIGDNRPGIGDNRPGLGGNRPNFGNNVGNNIGNNININNNINNVHNHNNWYHGCWHGNWNNGWAARPAAWWGAGFVSGAVVNSFMPYRWGYATYMNPYYVAPVNTGTTVINYSQPIVMAAQPEEVPATQVAPTTPPADPNSPPPPPTSASNEDEAGQLLENSRTAFYSGDYVTALSQVEKAIAKSPRDSALHEFRGLIQFAMKNYDGAAATIYAVLSSGPGWDWTTLASLYPNVDTYTQQLRSLEQYRKANPNSAQARFLLGYHYLTAGHENEALAEFQGAVKLQPSDQLSAQLVKMLTPQSNDEPTPPPADSAVASTPVDAAKLVGNWKAAQPDGTEVTLSIAADSKFSWKFTQNKMPQEITGTSTVADNLLILRPTDSPPLVGQVTLLADNKLNFKLDANNPGDQGLTFVR